MGKLSFNLKAVVPQDTAFYKARIEPGVHEVVITGIEEGTNDNGNDYIDLMFDNLEGTRNHIERMYCTTDKAIEWTSRRLKEIFVCIYGEGKEPDSLIVDQLKKAFVGKKLRCMFLGREIENKKKDGTFWVAELRLSNFCESLSVPADQSRFVFDKTKHMKAMPTIMVAPVKKVQFLSSAPVNTDGGSDMPFDMPQVPQF